jgi:hypothetical protein
MIWRLILDSRKIIFFSSSKRRDWLWCPPATYSVATEGFFAGLMWSGCEGNHLCPSSVEVTNEQNYTFTPPVCLRVCAGTDLSFLFYVHSAHETEKVNT